MAAKALKVLWSENDEGLVSLATGNRAWASGTLLAKSYPLRYAEMIVAARRAGRTPVEPQRPFLYMSRNSWRYTATAQLRADAGL